MKKTLLLLLVFSSLSIAKTTMCYIENHTTPSSIDNIPLKGGICNDKLSINQLKAQGWIVEDIGITKGTDGLNYTYILKNNSNSKQTTLSTTALSLKEEVIASIRADEKQQQLAKQQQLLKDDIESGKKYYIDKCQICHGEKGELEAENTSRPLNTLSYEEMEDSMRGYEFNEYDRGIAIVMKPYIPMDRDLKLIFAYLESIN